MYKEHEIHEGLMISELNAVDVAMWVWLSHCHTSIYIRWLLSSFFIPLHSFALASCVLFCPHFVVQGIEYYAFSQLSEKTGKVFNCSPVLMFGVIHCCCRKEKINWFCWIPRNLVSNRRGRNPAFLTPMKTEICGMLNPLFAWTSRQKFQFHKFLFIFFLTVPWTHKTKHFPTTVLQALVTFLEFLSYARIVFPYGTLFLFSYIIFPVILSFFCFFF